MVVRVALLFLIVGSNWAQVERKEQTLYLKFNYKYYIVLLYLLCTTRYIPRLVPIVALHVNRMQIFCCQTRWKR